MSTDLSQPVTPMHWEALRTASAAPMHWEADANGSDNWVALFDDAVELRHATDRS